jgi:hypothetical protein
MIAPSELPDAVKPAGQPPVLGKRWTRLAICSALLAATAAVVLLLLVVIPSAGAAGGCGGG